MSGPRYVVLGLARSRADWFASVTLWSTSGAVPVEFHRCLSTAELLARLQTARPVSAVLLDGGLPGVDRDLLDTVRRRGSAGLVVSGPADGDRDTAQTRWRALGADAVLEPSFDRSQLVAVLADHARPVSSPAVADLDAPSGDPAPPGLRAIVVAVCGTGGTGTSTVASAAAAGLGARAGWGSVVLADLTLRADQAMLHDVGEVAPGLQELVDLHRSSSPGAEDVMELTFDLADRDHRLLLGLRRARLWSTLPPRAVTAALESLARVFDVVVCDTDGDVEPDDSTPASDRTHLARASVEAADLVAAVARPGVAGTHALVRLATDLVDAGIDPRRLLPVMVGVGRSPRQRAVQGSALTKLLHAAGIRPTAPVLFLPPRPVDDAVRDGRPVPSPLPGLVAGAIDATLARLGPIDRRPAAPVLVPPGSLGLR